MSGNKQKLPKNPYIITGIKTGRGADGKWPPRREIDELMNDPDRKQAILFLVAYRLLQQRDLDEVLSYYSIGGIHGFPPRPWPATDGPKPPNGRGVYCEHHTYLFPTWHRIHMLLIEQALHDIIMKLVEPESTDIPIKEEERAAWRQAAETWRLPYWDPGLRRAYNGNASCIPESAMEENLPPLPGVEGPITLPFFYANPLQAYRFPLKPGDTLSNHGMIDVTYNSGRNILIPATKQQRTVRYAPFYDPTDAAIEEIWVNGISDYDKLKANFRLLTSGWREMLRSTFNDISRFHRFVYGTPTQEARDHLPSLTDFHDDIHGNTGGDTSDESNMTFGNMGSVPVAALDPIFFLWHASVDRYVAMWQAGHPGKTGDVWLTAAEDAVPLYPFVGPSQTNPDWWVSRDCRNIDNLGYTYKDVEDIRSSSNPTAALRQKVLNLYSDPVQPRPGFMSRSINPAAEAADEPTEGPETQYIFTAAYKPHEVGPFRCNIYLDVDGTSHLLGNIINFVASPDVECGNCNEQRRTGQEVESSTYISARLKELHQEGVIDEDYESAMERGLRWQLRNLRGEPITSEQLPSFRAGVTKREVLPPHQPVRGILPGEPGEAVGGGVRAVPLRGLTDGKPGGLREGEDFL